MTTVGPSTHSTSSKSISRPQESKVEPPTPKRLNLRLQANTMMTVMLTPQSRLTQEESNSYARRRRKSSSKILLGDDQIPPLYLHAKEQAWQKVANDISLNPADAQYVHPKDGTTALHLAVMSRTGFSMEDIIKKPLTTGADEECKINSKCPLELVDCILSAHPAAACQVCHMNTYTPLHYACLAAGEQYDLVDAESMVRAILKKAPSSTEVATAGGLSALDVHIVSFSQNQPTDEDPLSGRTNTVVLRCLLEHDPSLAHVRVSRDKVSGPIELLYRCNSTAFLECVSVDDIKKRRKPLSARSLEQSKNVMKRMTQWWVWRWTILLLKYGTLPHKKMGARFCALQAAAGLVGCPLPILTLAMNAFPLQIRQLDEMHASGRDGNLPLHEVCSWPCEEDVTSTDPVIPSRKSMAIASLLAEYPEAAKTPNRHLQAPLELAVASGTTWDSGIRKLVRAYPDAISIASKKSGLFPFMAAAVAAGESLKRQGSLPSTKRSLTTHLKNVSKQDLQFVRTIYGLLRANPKVLINCVTNQPQPGWETFEEDSDLWASFALQDSSVWAEFR